MASLETSGNGFQPFRRHKSQQLSWVRNKKSSQSSQSSEDPKWNLLKIISEAYDKNFLPKGQFSAELNKLN